MNLVLIGTGNVATVLGKDFVRAGHRILQVLGRNPDKTRELAEVLESRAISSSQELVQDADIYLLAVSDQSIQVVGSSLNLKTQLLVHTAGAVPMQILAGCSGSIGVFYPLQSLNKQSASQPDIPFLIDASNQAGVERLSQLAQSLGGTYQVCTDSQRLQMHLAAVWVNNFPNLLYAIAYRICSEKGLDFKLLLPLLQETANRQTGQDPFQLQTGPAIRYDLETMAKHLQLLDQQSDWQSVYAGLSDLIGQMGQAPTA